MLGGSGNGWWRSDRFRLLDDESAGPRVRWSSHRLSHRLRRRSRRGRRRRWLRRRQEPERVEVAERIGRQPNPEMNVWDGLLRRAARPHRGDDIAFADRRAHRNGNRAEVRERDRVPAGRLDREALAARRHEAREAHRSARGGNDRISRRARADVDAAVLAGVVRVRFVVQERLEHRSVDGPAPRARDRNPDEERHYDCCQFQQHGKRR